MWAKLLAYLGFTGPLARKIMLEGIKAGTGWKVDVMGRLRCASGRCVLGALVTERKAIDNPVPVVGYAAYALGIPESVAYRVILANDEWHGDFRDRAFLLAAAGL